MLLSLWKQFYDVVCDSEGSLVKSIYIYFLSFPVQWGIITDILDAVNLDFKMQGSNIFILYAYNMHNKM